MRAERSIVRLSEDSRREAETTAGAAFGYAGRQSLWSLMHPNSFRLNVHYLSLPPAIAVLCSGLLSALACSVVSYSERITQRHYCT